MEIPFLTINYHDWHLLEIEKCIDRGGFFKLISTYNNGNLYGICLLMFYPLYSYLEKNRFYKSSVVFSLLLTLSRTVWIGLFVAEIFLAFSCKKAFFFWKKALVTIVLGSGIFCLKLIFHLPLEFFLDKTLGHRINQFDALKTFSFFGEEPFTGIYEITYLGIYKSFGLLGLCSFCVAMFFPIYKSWCQYRNQPIHKHLLLGLIIYNIVSFSDGAILLIPVMCFYWFISSMSINDRLVVDRV